MRKPHLTTEPDARHWDAAYAGRGIRGVSWYQDVPSVSLELIEALGVDRDAAVIDVGGGASTLAEQLLERGFADVSVLDLSATALDEARRRLGHDAPVAWLHEDLLAWRPTRRFDLWHDRALFQFFVTPEGRDKYRETLRSTIGAGSFVVIATFAPDGPEFCSGRPVARYSVADLTALLGAGFELLETRREEHMTPRGVMQPFTWVAGRMQPA